jgi:hypothetical protein
MFHQLQKQLAQAAYERVVEIVAAGANDEELSLP